MIKSKKGIDSLSFENHMDCIKVTDIAWITGNGLADF